MQVSVPRAISLSHLSAVVPTPAVPIDSGVAPWTIMSEKYQILEELLKERVLLLSEVCLSPYTLDRPLYPIWRRTHWGRITSCHGQGANH